MGIMIELSTSVSLFMVFQTKKWNGNLKTLMIKNNQAAVPINSFLGSRIAKK